MIAKFRCGNSFWIGEQGRVCKLCGAARETVVHLLKECTELKERDESREEILTDNRLGVGWMKEICRAREIIMQRRDGRGK